MEKAAMKTMSLGAVVQEAIKKHGGVRAAARALDTSAPYLSRLARGIQSAPSAKLLRRMGVRRITVYTRTGEQ
jgi:hypothetical protein